MQNGEDKIDYDPKTGTLTIYSGEINIVDGWNRTKSYLQVVSDMPDINFKTGLMITNWDKDKTLGYIKDVNKQNKIPEEDLLSKDIDRQEIKVVRKINENKDSDLHTKIVTDTKMITHGDAFVKFSTLGSAIEYEYKLTENPKSMWELNALAKWLVEFFNAVIGINSEEFISNFPKSKETSYIAYENMFYGYISLAKELENDKNWEDKLYNIFTNIDFSINNSVFEKLDIPQPSISKSKQQKISEHFKTFLMNRSDV
jgi:hypothetical protein